MPLISGIASLLVAATFLFPLYLSAETKDVAGSTTLEIKPVGYLVLFAMYLVLAYVTIFADVPRMIRDARTERAEAATTPATGK